MKHDMRRMIRMGLMFLACCLSPMAQSWGADRNYRLHAVPEGDYWVHSRSPFREKLLEYWENKHQTMLNLPNQVFDDAFNSSWLVYAPLSGWLVEQDDRLKEDAQRQLAWAHSKWASDGFPTVPPDHQYAPYLVREQLGLEAIPVYASSQILDDPTYLAWVDKLAISMMTKLQRRPHTYNGTTYTLFCVLYQRNPPYSPVWEPTIDPNQNAMLGLLFTLLYHDPRSQLYLDATAKDIALQELSASMAIQLPTGELSLTDNQIGQYDTGYGTWAMIMWIWANQYWKDNAFQENFARGGSWLSKWMTADHLAEHFYPDHSFEAWKSEVWWRIGVYYQSHIDTSIFVRDIAYDPKWVDPGGALETGGVGMIIYLYLAGIPSSVYLIE